MQVSADFAQDHDTEFWVHAHVRPLGTIIDVRVGSPNSTVEIKLWRERAYALAQEILGALDVA